MKNIITISIVVLIIAGIAYGFSGVYKTRMDRKFDQMAHWTPENIVKGPDAYLLFCEVKTIEAMEDLKANEIESARKRAQMQHIFNGFFIAFPNII